MERLTMWGTDGRAYWIDRTSPSGGWRDDCGPVETITNKGLDRLAAYEDTGLTPEEINELTHKSYGPLHKKFGQWIDADQDGRLVVSPVKPGDRIYQLRSKRHARGVGVATRIVSCIEIRGDDYTVFHQGMTPCLKKDLGRTWFLTYEEAEAALREGRSC